jgi:pimeloyl-ACP methyl ester carboxylesterase
VRRYPGSRWVLFEHGSHMPHAEEPERFIGVLDAFLTGVEAAAES